MERRVRQPAAAAVRERLARVHGAGRGAARASTSWPPTSRTPSTPGRPSTGYVGLSEAIGSRDLRGAAGAGRPADALRRPRRRRRRPSEGDVARATAPGREYGAIRLHAMATRSPRRCRPAAPAGVEPGGRPPGAAVAARHPRTAGRSSPRRCVIVIGLSIFPAAWAFLLSLQKWDGFSTPTFVGAAQLPRARDRRRRSGDAVRHTGVYTCSCSCRRRCSRVCSSPSR